MRIRWIVSLVPVAGLAVALLAQQPAGGATPGSPAQVIEITAKKYEYSPSEIRVKKGTKVQLKVRALDRSHGMEFELYPEGADKSGPQGLVFTPEQKNYKLEKGEERVIEFVAERPGTYSFKCSVFCGFGHRGMRGKLIVEEK